MKKIIGILIALALVLSFTVVTATPVIANGGNTLEVSQPVQVTSDSHYERGQSIVYGGGYYWLFYGRSATVTDNYQGGNPDTHDYALYYKKATTVAELADAPATPIETPLAGYLGETGAAYFGSEAWGFMSVENTGTGRNDLYGWYSSDGSSWTKTTDPIVANMPSGAAHHDEITFDGKLFVAYVPSMEWTTKYSSTPKTGGWSTPEQLDAEGCTYGTGHFFVDDGTLYFGLLKTGGGRENRVYQYDSGADSWTKIASVASTGYDGTLFKVNSTYVFAQAPWVNEGGGRQYIYAWSSDAIDAEFFDRTEDPVMVTEGQYGSNTWTDMWPIGFTDQGGTSYLFYTSERDPDHPEQEMTGNIWYLPVDWPVTNGHYTYIQEAINAATSDTINVAAGTYHEEVLIDKPLTLNGANAGIPGYGTRGPESIIEGPNVLHGNAIYIFDGADGVIVDGFTLKAGDDIVENRADNVVIKNNIITPVASPVTSNAPGVFACECTSFTASYNLIQNIGGGGFFLGLTTPSAPITNSLIEHNLIDTGDYGIGIDHSTGDNMTIRYNTMKDFASEGIRVFRTGSGGVTILGNDISNCGRNGIRIMRDEDSHSIRFNNIYGTMGDKALKNVDDNTVVDATNNWWGTTTESEIQAMLGGRVTYDPWLGAELTEVDTGSGVDAFASITNASATATGGGTDTTVTVAEYTANPGDPPTGFSALGKYIDVYVPDTEDIIEIEIRVNYSDDDVPTGVSEESLRLFWWDGDEWEECSNSGVNTASNYIWAIITDGTTPSLDDLEGTPFGGGGPEAPTVTTQAATEVRFLFATVNMNYTVGDFSPVQVRFAYKKTADSAWSYTAWVSKAVDGTYAAPLTGLTSVTKYDFKAQLKYDTVIEGTILHFTTSATAGCFIATAAYGTPTAEQIDVLREFRDVVLLESTVGSQFVALYYQTSPPIADFISGSSFLRTLVRELLVDPVVWVVEATGDIWRN